MYAKQSSYDALLFALSLTNKTGYVGNMFCSSKAALRRDRIRLPCGVLDYNYKKGHLIPLQKAILNVFPFILE